MLTGPDARCLAVPSHEYAHRSSGTPGVLLSKPSESRPVAAVRFRFSNDSAAHESPTPADATRIRTGQGATKAYRASRSRRATPDTLTAGALPTNFRERVRASKCG